MINPNFKKEVEDLQKTYHETYKINHSLFTSAYNNESQMSLDYNGRQILELLQNADDAKAPLVKIILDKNEKTLTVENTGDTPFTSKGIESLMLANNSPKDSNESIGNKGLGFRAVIAWCDDITIYSNATKVEFSKEIVKNYVCKHDLSSIEELCLQISPEELVKLNKEKKIKPKNTIPFPILGMPKVTVSETDSVWTTRIILKYKNENIEESITEQLDLDENVLLFLRHLKDIEIEIKENGKELVCRNIHKESVKDTIRNYDNDITFEKIKLGNNEWNSLSKVGIFPNVYQTSDDEDEYDRYSSMIAWQDNLDTRKSYKLCCYFPTQIEINLPFIIHGNFEVNSARNLLVTETTSESRNEFLFENILTLIDCAVKIEQEKSDNSNWNSYKILHTTTIGTNGLEKFIEGLNTRLDTMSIYPSIDKNKYLTKRDYRFYSNELSNFFEKKFPDNFPEMIKSPLDLAIGESLYESDCFFKKLNGLKFDRKSEIEDRSDLIKFLYDFSNNHKNTSWVGNLKANLLINDSYEPIGNEKTAFINSENPSVDYKINKPEYVKFELTHQQLNNDLYKKLKVSSYISNRNNDNNPKRKLCEMLDPFINVKDFDITEITKLIISKTNDLIEDNPSNFVNYIKEMTINLYLNYKERRTDWGNPDFSSICFLNKNYKKVNASELYFSETYNTNNLGKNVESIFEGINTDEDYLLSFDNWNLFDKDEMEIVCDFFAYFGVNEFVTVKNKEIKKDLHNYFNYSYNEIYSKYPENYRLVDDEAKFNNYLAIQNLEKIKQIKNITKLIQAIFLSRSEYGERSTELLNKLKINTDYFVLHFHQNYPRVQVLSYVAYQLISTGLFTTYYIDEAESSIYKLINKNNLLDFKILQKQGISKKDVFDILSKLGCKTNLSEYEPKYIYSLLRDLESLEEYKDGTGTQSIYFEAKQAFVEIAKKENVSFDIPSDIKYFAFKDGIGEYVSKDDIYYFDNNSMPKIFLDKHYILNMKKRAGEDAFQKYFGTKKTENIDLKLSDLQGDKCPNDKFNQIFKRLKPYILAYRFSYTKLDEENKNKNAKIIEAISIKLINFGMYKIDNSKDRSFNDYEFFYNKVDQKYYLKVPENIEITDLIKNSEFQNSFSEIICSAFKLVDNVLVKDLRLLISYDENELKKRISDDREISIEDIEDCKKRLNIKDSPLYNFWKEIIKQKNIEIELPDSSENLRKMLLCVPFNLPDDLLSYDSYDDFNSKDGFKFLCSIKDLYQIDLKELLISLDLNLREYNLSRLEQVLDSYRKRYIDLLWNYCFKERKQGIFISEQIKYEKILSKFSFDKDLDFQTDINYKEKCLLEINKLNSFFCIDGELPNGIKNHEELPQYSKYAPCVINTDEKYLLYFPDNEDKLKEKWDKYQKEIENENRQLDEDLHLYDDVDIKVTKVTCQKPIELITKIESSSEANKPHIVDENDNRKKRNSGLRAEKLLKAYFKKNQIQFEQRSGMSKEALGDDNNHFDFYYYNRENNKTFVEVKSSTDGSFYISESERKFAEQHADNYEFALVDIHNKSITFVKDAFSYVNNPNQDFRDNDRFFATPVEYFVKLNVVD